MAALCLSSYFDLHRLPVEWQSKSLRLLHILWYGFTIKWRCSCLRWFCWDSSRINTQDIYWVIQNMWLLSEHGQKNGVWCTITWATVREAPDKKAEILLSQEYFIPCVVHRHYFMPPMANDYLQFMRHIYFCWMSKHSCRIQSGQCTLNLDVAFCLVHAFQDILYNL